MINIVPIRRSLVLAAVLAAGLGAAACSGGGGGGSDPTTSASSSSNNAVAAIDPCALLSPDDVTKLGLTSRGREDTAKSHGCGWSKGATYSFGIYADPTQGLDALRAANSTTLPLASHDGMQTANGIDCLVDIAITKSSSVGISIEAGGGNACGIAAQYATLIEPKLPAQQK